MGSVFFFVSPCTTVNKRLHLLYESGLKSSYDIISTVDEFSEKWDHSIAIPMEQVYELQMETVEK